MNKYLKIAVPLALLASLILILSFKTLPGGKLWKEYKILYVPVESNDSEVLKAIKDSGIKDEVALSKQYLPLNLRSDSVEFSMFRVNADKKAFSYYKDRNAYFFDKSQAYRLYYIPSEYTKELDTCLDLLNLKNIPAGTDSNSTYPWIIPLIYAVLIIILSLFAKKKILFISSSIPALIFLLCNPLYPIALANILLLLCIFFVSNLWGRKGSFLCLISDYKIPGMLAVSLICAFSISFKIILLYLCEIIAICSTIETYKMVEDYLKSKKSFIPVYIKNASMVSIYAKKQNPVMISIILSSVLLISTFLLTSSKSFSQKFTKVLLPAADNSQAEELPLLENYYNWVWQVESFPYRALNKDFSSDAFIEYPQYSDNGGFITESKKLKAYNQNYKDNLFDDIDKLQFNSIEKVLKSEGKNLQTNYNSVSIFQINLFSKIMMLICLFVLLFIYFFIIIRRDSKV